MTAALASIALRWGVVSAHLLVRARVRACPGKITTLLERPRTSVPAVGERSRARASADAEVCDVALTIKPLGKPGT